MVHSGACVRSYTRRFGVEVDKQGMRHLWESRTERSGDRGRYPSSSLLSETGDLDASGDLCYISTCANVKHQGEKEKKKQKTQSISLSTLFTYPLTR